MSNSDFNVYKRNTEENKNRLRKSGYTPGIIYGDFLNETIPVKMNDLELKHILSQNSSGSIIEVLVDNKKLNCVVKEIQKDYNGNILHIDFQYVKPHEVIKMRIPIKITGQELLESKRLTLETYNLYIDLQGDANQIPESIELDASDMQLDDKILIKDISIPDDISVLTDSDTLLAVASTKYIE